MFSSETSSFSVSNCSNFNSSQSCSNKLYDVSILESVLSDVFNSSCTLVDLVCGLGKG